MDGANDARLATEARPEARREGHRAALRAAHGPRRVPRPGDINAELQQLATTYPDKVKLFALKQDVAARQDDLRRRGQPQRRPELGQAGLPAHRHPHAREWPTAEFTLEFVNDLLMHDGTDADATSLLENGKLIAVPVVNPTATTSRAACRTSRSARTAGSRPASSRRSPTARWRRTSTAASTSTATTCRSGAARARARARRPPTRAVRPRAPSPRSRA